MSDVMHARDLMQMSRDGDIADVAMCGESGKIVFGDIRHMLTRKGDHCEKCVRAWEEERDSSKEYMQLRHQLRLGLMRIVMRGAKNAPSRIIKP